MKFFKDMGRTLYWGLVFLLSFVVLAVPCALALYGGLEVYRGNDRQAIEGFFTDLAIGDQKAAEERMHPFLLIEDLSQAYENIRGTEVFEQIQIASKVRDGERVIYSAIGTTNTGCRSALNYETIAGWVVRFQINPICGEAITEDR